MLGPLLWAAHGDVTLAPAPGQPPRALTLSRIYSKALV